MGKTDTCHGGDDPGASGNGIVEKELTLLIAQELERALRAQGVDVTMTRTTDETISPAERVNRILNAYGNNSDVIVVSNHINAGGGEGAEVIYALRNDSTLSNLVLNELENEGQVIRKAYQRRLPSNTSKDYYFIQRETGITEPITVEYGFLDTVKDADKSKANYKRYAQAVARALLNYIGLGDNVYTVQKGDSLWSIARKFNTTVNELKSYNGLTSNTLSIGQVLKIPTQIIEEDNVYTVKSGDTLYAIASKYNTTVDAIKQKNNLTTNTLNIGQKLVIPEQESDEVTYTVKSGDTLYTIANKYNTTVQELMEYNNLKSNLLSIGQTLKIPVEDFTESNTYTVVPGDTLYSIARKFNTTVDTIKQKNNLTTNMLSIGQILQI